MLAVVERQNAERIAESEVWSTSIGITPSVGAGSWCPRAPLGPTGGDIAARRFHNQNARTQ